MGLAPVLEIQRATALRQPAHDHLVRRDHLLAVDAEILARFRRSARDHQTPGDQRRDIAGPAGLDRQPAQIDILTFPHHILAGRAGQDLRRHGQHLLQHRPLFPGVLQSFRRFGFLQVGEQLAHLAQCINGFFSHAQRHASRRAEQVGQDWYIVSGRILEQDRRTLRAQHPVTDLGHFQAGRNRHGDAFQFAEFFQLRDEIAQVVVFHR